jgi:lysophospholipase L1-like esterase
MSADSPTPQKIPASAVPLPHSVILFQGDSITDAGRNRLACQANKPSALGEGYARMAALDLLERYPDRSLQCYNRGVSGDTLADLSRRWARDTLPLLPDLLSVLIGVNDLWQALSSTGVMGHDRFRENLRELLVRTRKAFPEIRLALCQPFLLPAGMIPAGWMDEAARLGETTAVLAEEFTADLVPFQQALNDAAAEQPPSSLLFDGVHPTPDGHRLLTDCWLDHVVGNP